MIEIIHIDRERPYMKLKYLFFTTAVITITVGILCCCLPFSNSEVESFDMAEFQMVLTQFASAKKVEEIHDADTAAHQAEKIWVEMFGQRVLDKKPYQVFFDSTNDVWLIKGTLPGNYFGGVPYALIRSDGDVLAVWHEK